MTAFDKLVFNYYTRVGWVIVGDDVVIDAGAILPDQ